MAQAYINWTPFNTSVRTTSQPLVRSLDVYAALVVNYAQLASLQSNSLSQFQRFVLSSFSSADISKIMSLALKPYYPDYSVAPIQHQFSPYADNGGSVVAIAGDDFVIIGADTRLSAGFSIYTRNQNKLFPLTKTTVLGCSGCWCDTLTLTRILKSRMQMYQQEHNKIMSTTACAQMLSTMLYYKRFFPYYISNVLVGLDNEGKGCVYSYDPIGHCEKTTYRAGGSAGALLQPLLDNQIGQKNMEIVSKEPLTQEKALNILKDVFISAAERDIYTGDSVFINIITKDGIKEDSFNLRKD